MLSLSIARTSESDRGELVHWIGYWIAYYLVCVEPAVFDFLTYWWMPFRQVFKGGLLLWLAVPRSSRLPNHRDLPTPSVAVSEGIKAAEEMREYWVNKLIEDGKKHYAAVMAKYGYGNGADQPKPGIKGWDSLGYAFLTSCFYLFLESYH